MQMTLDLPGTLHDRLCRAMARGVAESEGELVSQAIEQYLDSLDHEWIDEQFASMASDPSYQALQRGLADEFAALDEETWRMIEPQDAAPQSRA